MPNFFRRWLARELGGTPRFLNPHVRVERLHDDLTKHSMFCADCEALMSRDESVARREVLGRWREPMATGSYGPWLLRFGVGLAMKAAAVQLRTEPTAKSAEDRALQINHQSVERLPPGPRGALEDAFDAWRNFLLGRAPHPGRYEIHLLEVDLAQHPGLYGLFGHNHIHNVDFSALLVYLNGLVLVALTRGHVRGLLRETRLTVNEGKVGLHNSRIPPAIDEVLSRMSAANLHSQHVSRTSREGK